MSPFLASLLLLVLATGATAAAPLTNAFPLRVDPGGRHLLDASGRPFLYHADTAWFLFQKLTLEEADEYLATRRAQGFNTVQVMLTGWPGQTNRAGHLPFQGGNDFRLRDEQYFTHVDRVVKQAEQHGLMLAIAPLWAGCCGEGWAGRDSQGRWLPMNTNGPDSCRELGRFLGRRYSGFPNLMWILGGDNDPGDSRALIEQLALGLRDTAPDQLRTYHAASSHSSTDLWPEADWLSVSMVYTYFRGFNKAWTRDMPDVYEVSWREYGKPLPKPFFLGESTYEGEHDAWGSALQARKQAYWVLLGGGTGHAYGSPNWRCDPGWREGLQRPGALSLAHWHRLFTSRPWWLLAPDTSAQWLVDGAGVWATNDLATAALATDGSFAVAYLPSPRTVTVDLGRLQSRSIRAWWFDPRSGEATSAGAWRRKSRESFPRLTFQPPGQEDWVLVVEDSTPAWPVPGAAHATRAATPAAVADAPRVSDWQALFDGKTSTGWRGFRRNAFPDQGWVIEDGVLKKVPGVRGGDIVAEAAFEEFEFAWEWKIPPRANSGVKYFILEERGSAIGHEYQMIDDQVAGGAKHRTASFYDVLPPDPGTPSPRIGDWNESRIVVRGQHVEHWLNGHRMLDYELGSPEVRRAVAQSKFKDVAGFGERVRGRILLTDHTDEAWFRHLRIRDLSGAGETADRPR